MKHTATTQSGQLIDFANPHPSMIHLPDIAAGLSKMCRWNGQIIGFYSVAQHSLLGADFMRTKELEAAFLLHDATEAYIADVIRPARGLFDGYLELEEVLAEVIYARFNVNFELYKHPAVREMDDRMLLTERDQFRRHTTHDAKLYESFGDLKPLPIIIDQWPWEMAQRNFLGRAMDLLGTEPWSGGPPPLQGWEKLYADDAASHHQSKELANA